MERVIITKDGSISIPVVGNMKITVEMTEGLFEEFMDFRKNKEKYETETKREIEAIRAQMTFLARAVLDSVNGKTAADKKAAKEEMLERANEWFC